MAKKTVLCFGEVLWDCLPAGLFLGGAPVNVAYHLQQLGEHSIPLSAVGDDFLGQEVLRRMRQWGVETSGVRQQGQQGLPTGTVIATLDDSGNASYEIKEGVAWDEIGVAAALSLDADAIIFGSLAQRSEHNRQALDMLLRGLPNAMKVFDVNFRPPFDDVERSWELAAQSSLVKLNHDEAARLTGGKVSAYEANARQIADKSGAALVCVTAGDAGAGLLMKNQWVFEAAQSVEVADTVGAGDSFLAALVAGLLSENDDVAVILRRACRLAEFVASQRGAQPAYDANSFEL
jgi:fructokinase